MLKEPAKTNKLSIIKWPYQAIFYLEKDRLKKSEVYNFGSYQKNGQPLSQHFPEKIQSIQTNILAFKIWPRND